MVIFVCFDCTVFNALVMIEYLLEMPDGANSIWDCLNSTEKIIDVIASTTRSLSG
jgi:hypothetical protein